MDISDTKNAKTRGFVSATPLLSETPHDHDGNDHTQGLNLQLFEFFI